MDSRACEYFLAVVDHDGFGRGAESLHISQPALSIAIAKLERDLGTPLFKRVGRGVVLSDAGRVFVESARRVVHEIEEARTTMQSLNGLRRGYLTVAAPPSLSATPLAGLVSRFRARFPGVTVVMHPTEDGALALAAVERAESELALTDRSRPSDRLKEHSLLSTEMVVALPPGFPIPAGNSVALSDLAGTPFISTQPGTRSRALLDAAINDGIDLPVAVRTPHREAIIPLVLQGVGAAILPDATAHQARRRGAVVRPISPAVTYTVSLLHRNGPLTAAASAFLKLTLAECTDSTP